MKVRLLGTGTPMSVERFQSSALVEAGEDLLLFDAGRGAVHQMFQAGVDVSRVRPVFITHNNFDHINDLVDAIVSTAWRGRRRCKYIDRLVPRRLLMHCSMVFTPTIFVSVLRKIWNCAAMAAIFLKEWKQSGMLPSMK